MKHKLYCFMDLNRQQILSVNGYQATETFLLSFHYVNLTWKYY